MLDPSLVMTDVPLLSGILELSLESPFLSPVSFFRLVLLLFLSCLFFLLMVKSPDPPATPPPSTSPKSLQHFLDFFVWVLLNTLGMTVAMGRG